MNKYVFILTWGKEGPTVDSFYKCNFKDYYASIEEFKVAKAIDPTVGNMPSLPAVKEDIDAIQSLYLRARYAIGDVKMLSTEADITIEQLEDLLRYYHKHQPEHKLLK